MVLTDGQAVRLLIQDQPLIADYSIYGDGTASSFVLRQRNLTTASAFVPAGHTAWTATGATFEPSGAVAFSRVIPGESAVRLTFVHSVFSDAEIDHFLTQGSQHAAAKEAVVSLMFDGLKRASWQAPDGSSYDDTRAMELLRSLYLTLEERIEQEATTEGGVISWAEQQPYYP